MELVTTRAPMLRALPFSTEQRPAHGRGGGRLAAVGLAVALHGVLAVLWPEARIPVSVPTATEVVQMVTLVPLPPVAGEAESSGGASASGLAGAPSSGPSVGLEPAPTLDLDMELAIGGAGGAGDVGGVGLPVFEDATLDEPFQVPNFAAADGWMEYDSFAPYMVRPEVSNRTVLKRFLERHYQPILEFSGATGVVHISFWIDEQGMVQRAEIAESSGSRSLDRLAMRVSRILRFRPAIFAGKPVRVQVRLPITFQAA